jgi:ubiquitin carboxyl-terminal hydrolase 9/24
VDNASNIHNLMLKPLTSNIPKPPPLPKRKDVVDGIDFAPASAPVTEIGC